MDQLITGRIDNPGEKLCNLCKKDFPCAAVKCNNCNEFLHLECTGMPNYMTIRYFTSRSTYQCEICMKSNIDKYEELLEWLNNNRRTTDESSKDSATNEAIGNVNTPQNNDQIAEITTALTELKGQITELTKKIYEIRANEPQRTSNNTREENAKQTETNKPTTKTRQTKPQNTSYAEAAAKVNPNQQVVFIKPKDPTTPANNEEITAALKNVPIVNAKTSQKKTVKLVFPSEATKDRAIEALEANNQIAENHQIIREEKLKPKICITYVPNYIEDSEIVQSIQDKNKPLTDLMVHEDDMKLLFTKPSTSGYKTAVIKISPSIRKEIEKNDNKIYLHLSRYKIYDHYWVRRCGNCMGYGHKTAHCHAEEPICGHCAQKHRSVNCTNKHQPKCHHCTTNGKVENEHSTFSTQCPTFIQAKQSIIRRTMRCADGETERVPSNTASKN